MRMMNGTYSARLILLAVAVLVGLGSIGIASTGGTPSGPPDGRYELKDDTGSHGYIKVTSNGRVWALYRDKYCLTSPLAAGVIEFSASDNVFNMYVRTGGIWIWIGEVAPTTPGPDWTFNDGFFYADLVHLGK